MGERLDGDIAKAQDTLKRARNMEEKYVTLIQNQMNEGGDPQLARNLEFHRANRRNSGQDVHQESTICGQEPR
jgi:hypothetical protein